MCTCMLGKFSKQFFSRSVDKLNLIQGATESLGFVCVSSCDCFFHDSPKSNLGANYKKILRLSYDVIITYDNRKSNLR